MITQTIAGDRRRRPRQGVLAQLEDITYTILRKHGISEDATRVERCGGTVTDRSAEKKAASQELVAATSACLLPSSDTSQHSTNKQLSKEDTSMSTNLVVVVRNPEPNREHNYPGIWLLYRQGPEPLEVHVGHDGHHRPHVLAKGAA